MLIREVRPEERQAYNQVVTHPLQSWEWGEFRQKTGLDVVRLGVFDQQTLIDGFQVTFHPIPKLPFMIGYLPKCSLPNPEVFRALRDLGRRKQAIFIKLEPNISKRVQFTNGQHDSTQIFFNEQKYLFEQDCVFGKPLFTKFSFMLDLRLPNEALLSAMHQKTRYNIGVGQRKGVTVIEDNSPEAFEDYLRLTFDVTTKRQKFYAHNREYHQQMWEVLRKSGTAHLLTASYENQRLVTWVVFTFNQMLYYPYGASSSENREVMASNIMMWEAIQFGKNQGCHSFDMWGSLGPDADPKDPWFGFHHFKEGFGPKLMEFVGTYDFVLDNPKYQVYKLLDRVRWTWLRLRTKLPL